MDLKSLLADLDQAIDKHCAQLSSEQRQRFPARDEIRRLADEINGLKSEIKRAKDEKGHCARKFKEAKDSPAEFAALKEDMQRISLRLGELEEQKKQREESFLNLFVIGDSQEEDSHTLPSQLRHRLALGDKTKVDIIELDDNARSTWDAYVAEHPGASIYHDYRWRKVIEQAFGHPSYYLAALDGNKNVVGILPFVWLNSRLFGSFGVSVPYFNYGGPLANSQEIASALMEHAGKLAHSLGLQHLEVRTTNENFSWPASDRKVSMIRKLPTTEEQFERDIGAKVRAQVKQGTSHGPKIVFGGLELLDDFYEVFSTNMRDLGTPVYDKQFFAAILRAFPENAVLVSVTLEGRPVAAAFLLGHRDLLEIPWASTLKRVNNLNINMWMYFHIQTYAIRKGYEFFDFGRSSVDGGTFRFKKQWGAEPVTHYWYYWLPPGGTMPGLNPDNPKYKLLIAVWQRMPVWLTKIIGPPIVKNLP